MKMPSCFLAFFVLASLFSSGQKASGPPKVTDLFSAEEKKRAGISKLSSEEVTALNEAIFRVFVDLNSERTSAKVRGSGSQSDGADLDFYDSRGRAVAYIAAEDEGGTVYLWDGKPVAYLDEESIFGFNGKHLGWLKGNAIYDHDGNVVAAMSNAFSSAVEIAPPKGFKQFLPFKSFKELKPFKPFFASKWCDVPAKVFFLKGTQ